MWLLKRTKNGGQKYQLEGLILSHACLLAKPPLKGEVPAIGGRRGSLPSAAKVAAALSAAVTTTQPIGNAPNSQAEPTKKKSRKPNANRSSGEGVWGRGASLREAASPPESPPTVNLFGREREGGGFSTEKPPPSHHPPTLPLPLDIRLGGRRGGRDGRRGLAKCG